LKVAAQKKSVANRLKNAQGMLAGLKRLKPQERRRREEARLAEYARAKERAAHRDVLKALADLARARRERADREWLLDQISAGPPLLAVALDVVRRTRERQKPDLDREPSYMDRNAVQLWKLQERRLRDFVPEVEAELVAALLVREQRLPENARITALAKLRRAGDSADRLARALLPRIRVSRLSNTEHAKRLFDAGTPGDLEHSADPWLDVASELAPELEALEETRKTERGLEARVAPAHLEMLKAVRGTAVYPDANGTLRFSYARVMGYEPQDGLLARPQTTLSGAIQKHTGVSPFDFPKVARDKASAAKNSYWADAHLDDLPVCFLSNADTTGGNSGSPVINGRGELVGLNFDRVWENVAGDFGYSAERSRNISVDVRYLLWLLDRVENATSLLKELGVAQFRATKGPGTRAHAPASAKRAADPEEAEPPEGSSCACGVAQRGSRSFAAVLGGCALFAGLRRLRETRRSLP
jgi:hypothetical protein